MSWSWLPNPRPKMFTPPGFAAPSSTPMRSRIEWCASSSRPSSETPETFAPFTVVPWRDTDQVVSVPYCDPSSFHHAGVRTPRRSPKCPGEVQVPMRCSLTHRLMSDGQLLLVPGTSDEISRLNLIPSMAAPATRALLGKRPSERWG